MKPLNHTEIKKANVKFVIIFGLCLTLLFMISFCSIFVANKGIGILEEKHAWYNTVFEKQAEFTFELDEIISLLYKVKNKDRSLSEQRQLQSIITNLRHGLETDIEKSEATEYFDIYTELTKQIKVIQTTLDSFEEDAEEYNYNKELLERCREKYRELALSGKD